jgi:hypothetical protein
MKRDYCHRFWVGSIGISASNYCLSRSSIGKSLARAIGGEKSASRGSWSSAYWLGRVPAYSGGVMSDASDFLTKWVRKNITPTTAHIRNDTLTAGRLAEECLWEAQGENLSEADVTDAAGGNLLTFMVSELNRASGRGPHDE